MKEWSKENRGNWKHRKDEILRQIANWEIIQEHRVKKQEIAWKQRFKVQWLKHGDKNTKFFHRIATSNKRFNSMEQLDVEGNIVKDPAVIKEAVQNFYINLYKEAEHWRPDLNIQDVNMKIEVWGQEFESTEQKFTNEVVVEIH